jgi:hypothetical protein
MVVAFRPATLTTERARYGLLGPDFHRLERASFLARSDSALNCLQASSWMRLAIDRAIN